MIETTATVTCDKCSKKLTADKLSNVADVWELALTRRHLTSRTYSTVRTHVPNKAAHWCRACMERAGLLPQVELKGETLPAPLTMEDMLREIIREEIAEAHE